MIHRPVLVKEVMTMLAVKENGVYVDGTLGTGGHTLKMLENLGDGGRIIGIDKDAEALRITAEKVTDPRVSFMKEDFSNMLPVIRGYGYDQVDGILLDLGVSMMQMKTMERGFSFASDAPLDMRMDTSMPLTAWEVVNRYPARKLEEILDTYGEEKRARRIVRAIMTDRGRKPINTCRELAQLITRVVREKRRIHQATKTFQALRIYVNRELETLSDTLSDSWALLGKGGRLCVISYHSLEDRIVKNFFREEAKKGNFRILTKKPVTPSYIEMRENPSSRSAKLRGGERL